MTLPLVRSELAYAIQRCVTMNVTALIEKAAERSCVLAHSIQHFAGAVKYTLRSPTRGQHCQKRECVNYLFHAALSCFLLVRVKSRGFICQGILDFSTGNEVERRDGFRYWGVMGRWMKVFGRHKKRELIR